MTNRVVALVPFSSSSLSFLQRRVDGTVPRARECLMFWMKADDKGRGDVVAKVFCLADHKHPSNDPGCWPVSGGIRQTMMLLHLCVCVHMLVSVRKLKQEREKD